VYPEGFAIVLWSAPFIETISGNYAATLRKRVLERWPRLNRFGLRVNAGSRGAAIGGPAVHKTPSRRMDYRFNDHSAHLLVAQLYIQGYFAFGLEHAHLQKVF
jgi:hypothetical protein